MSHSFRENLRRTLLLYAAIPLLAATLLLFAVLGTILIRNVMIGSREDGSAAVRLLTNTETRLNRFLDGMEADLDPASLRTSPKALADFSERLYPFIKRQESSPLLLITDEKDQAVFLTKQALNESEQLLLTWRALYPLHRAGRLSRTVRTVDQDGSVLTGWLIGRRLQKGGYAVFWVSQSSLQTLLNQFASGFVLTDPMEHVVLDTTGVMTGSLGESLCAGDGPFSRKEHETYYRSVADAPGGAFRLYTLRPCGSLGSTLVLSLVVVLGLFVCIFVTLYFATAAIARKKTAAVDQIASFCAEVQAGHIQRRLTVSGGDELETIALACNDMLDSLQSLMDRSVALSQEKNMSRIKQLETEFNPHFLFNALENIRYMIRLDQKAAEEMIQNLSALLRYSLEMNEDTVPLSRDIGYTKAYLHILQMRFGQRLLWSIDVADDLLACPIPRLIMQPIIENAVKYSMDAKPSVTVAIRICAEGEALLIRIRDNGPGFDPDKLTAIRQLLQNPASGDKQYVGIRNVHERLRLMYGNGCGVRIETGKEGTTMTLNMPLKGRSE